MPVLPSEFGGSGSSGVLSGFNYGGPLSNAEVHDGKGNGEEKGENGGRKGEEKGEEEKKKGDQEKDLTLNDVMSELRKLSVNVVSNFQKNDVVMAELKAEVATLRAEVVNKSDFERLEARVSIIEKKDPIDESGEMKLLKQQLSRLDPANRSLRIRGFADESLAEREKVIDKLMADLGVHRFSVESIYKGPTGQRVLTDMCVVAVNSNNEREKVLKVYEKNPEKNRGNL